MKFLLILVLTGLSFRANADELQSIPLIIPTSYQKSYTPGSSTPDNIRGFASTMTSKFLVGLGDLAKVDVHNMVNSKIEPYHETLAAYHVSAAQLDQSTKAIIQEGINTYLTQKVTDKNGKTVEKIKLTDDNLIPFYGFLGNKLVDSFADKVLTKEGVTNPIRRDNWRKKLLKPFNECMQPVLNAKFDADHCLDALVDSFAPTMGLAIVYELSLANLTPALPPESRGVFNQTQMDKYRQCVQSKIESKKIIDEVKNCALISMRNGLLKVTDFTLTQKINENASSKVAAAEIKKLIWPNFDSCTQKVVSNPNSKESYSNQFTYCIDNLIQDTGYSIVQDKIKNNPSVKIIFSETDRAKLALEKSLQFKRCVESQKDKGIRVNGILDISPCENNVTNEITYKVVSEIFKNKAKAVVRHNVILAEQLSSNGIAQLDKCWNFLQKPEQREACLRKTTITFSVNLAEAKLIEVIPNTTLSKTSYNKADLIKTSLATLEQCMKDELPQNISESPLLDKKIDECTGKLGRKTALLVADHQIRLISEGNISKQLTDELVKKLVDEKFSNCIGLTPNDNLLDTCADTLTRDAAKGISEISFDKEVYAYIKTAGGVNALGVTNSEVKKFISNLTDENAKCIDQKSEGIVIDQVNTCIKGSIKKIAFFFGETQFEKEAGSMYTGRNSDKKVVKDAFEKALSGCLDVKNAIEFSITDYTTNLYQCAKKTSFSTTMIVAQDQVSTALESYLKDRPGIDLSEQRKSTKKTLLATLQKCMSSTQGANCIDNLKREATKSIVLEYSKVETKVQINTDKTPPELKLVETDFASCTNSNLKGDALTALLDKCIKNFALDFAKALGAFKLNYLLKQTLGSEDYNAQKSIINKSLEEYNDCLEQLEKYSISEGLTDKLSTCTDDLTNKGISIVRSNINTWMTTEQKDAATVMIKYEFAQFLPCLSLLLPVSPYQELQATVDSSVKPLAILLSHYIEYNPENAQQTLNEIMKKLSVDFNDIAATHQAKVDLLDFLYQSGALDQFIKAIVRGTVKDSLKGLSEKEVPNELKEVLLQKKIYEEIFDSKDGSRIKSLIMEKLLKPALILNEDMHGVPFNNNLDAIKDNIVTLLIDAPSFGEQAIKMSIQTQINSMNTMTKLVAKTIYGNEALKWEKVRLTKNGQEAEAYIRANVLMPRFKNMTQTESEKKKINVEVEKLVKKAIKNYDSN